MKIANLKTRLFLLGKKLIPTSVNYLKEKLWLKRNEDLRFGDYSTNFLFILANQLQQPPQRIFENLKDQIQQLAPNLVSEITFNNGYLNFRISDKVLFQTFRTLVKEPFKFFQEKSGRRQKINIEFVSANPTGPLTLGNGRGAVIGEVLAKVLKLNHYRITKEYYNNDRGRQIALLGESILANLNLAPANPEHYQGEYIVELADKFAKSASNFKSNPEKLGRKVAEKILKNMILKPLRKFGVSFDKVFSESELYQESDLLKKVFKKLEEKNLVEQKEGAWWLKLTKIGENKDEVLIKSNGEYTYFLSDILYHYHKLIVRRFKKAIVILGADHWDHVRRLKGVLKIFKKEKNYSPIVYQLVQLAKKGETFKMSKRKGVFVSLDELIEEVGPDPVKFFFLLHPPETHIVFDIDLAKKQSEENPVWYLKYAYVRAKSILNQAKKMKLTPLKDPLKAYQQFKDNELFLNLLRRIHQFKYLLTEISSNYLVNLIALESLRFAKEFHQFYEKEKIILPEHPVSRARLLFIKGIVNFFDFIFWLIDLKKPKKM